MTELGKFALMAALVAGSAVFARAQHDVNAVATQENTGETQAAPADTGGGGRRFPAGWSLSTGGSVMEFFDTNPLMTPVASSDNGEQLVGRVDVSNIGAKTSYVASYVPAYFRYRRFSRLNSFSQGFSQNLHHAFSKRDEFNWALSAEEYSSWGNGSSFSGSSMGVLTLSLLGLSQFDLMSKVSTAGTTLSFSHVIDRRSSVNFSMSGGVFHYSRPHDLPYSELFLRPGSNTWTGSVGAYYDYRIDKSRSIGVGAAHSYMVNTLYGEHQNQESLQLRYSQQFRNNWAISVAVGPSWVLAANRRPSFDLSFTASHTSKRGSFQAELQHTFAPGIEPGQTSSWAGRASYSHFLSRHWVASALGMYQQSEGSHRTGVNSRAQIYLAAGQLGYQIRPHVTWFANYGYSLQSAAVTNYMRLPRQQIATGISFEIDGLLRQ